MNELMTIDEITEHFGITPASARRLLSDHGIRQVRGYPTHQVLAITRPGKGARTDLKGSDVITDRDIRDQVRQATDASEGIYDVDAIVRRIVSTYGRVSIEGIDTYEFWTLVMAHNTD